jgi:rSAM/selenodomain-associated transferase 1
MHRALFVIGKAPIPGEAKTRLVPPLSAEDAAALYRGFLLDTLQLAKSLHWERTSLIHPRGHADLLRPIAQGAELVEQPGEGLGRALQYAFESAGNSTAVLIGSDNPTLPAKLVRSAHAELEAGSDVVLGPTIDGGYYLIGMRRLHAGLFENIDWSTSRVLRQTMERAAELRLSVTTVDEWYDVDEAADLERLQRELAVAPPKVAPNTRQALLLATRGAPLP